MEPLFAQLRRLPARFMGLPERTRTWLLVSGGALALVVVAVTASLSVQDRYEYAFTGLTPDDSAAAVAQLRGAGIPHRVEAGGEALSVPADRVYDARILLSSMGLPRSGGVGFELFDRNEIGVSEFTQRVNLQRAIEGELSRTIASLQAVRSARVHVTMPKRGLFVEDDQAASASVVLGLFPGRSLSERELSGVQHLVAAAVPGLALDRVTIVDQSGALLGKESGSGGESQRKLERELEVRIQSILEPMVGPGAVVAKVTVDLDTTQVETQTQEVDPSASAVVVERVRNQQRTSQGGPRAQLAGAAANQGGAQQGGATSQERSTNAEEDRQFDVTKTVTTEKTREPRLSRLSIAVLVRDPGEDPWPKESVEQMSELAKKAVGFDEDRGDQFQISSAPFLLPPEAPAPAPEPAGVAGLPWPSLALVGVGVLALAGVAFAALRARRKRASEKDEPNAGGPALEDEAQLGALEEGSTAAALAAPAAEEVDLRTRARELVLQDPQRARFLLQAWMEDASQERSPRGEDHA